MDPLSGLSLACNIIQLVDNAIQCSKAAAEIYNSHDGWTRDQEQAEQQLSAFENHISALHRCQVHVGDILTDDEIRNVSALFLARCDDLRERLDCCRAKRRRNVLSTAKAMAKYHWGVSGDIREIQEGMVDLRKQLEFLLLRNTYNGVASLLSTCEDLGQQNTKMMGSLKSLEQQFKLTHGSRQQLSPGECETTLRTARDLALQAAVLEALHFASIDQRFSDVRDAHPGTFEWIFKDPDLIRKKEPDLAMTMPEWLRSGSGTFHVMGKPGAGKSTLMKFLTLHSDMRKFLEEWAGDKELIFANFFFWKIGTDGNQKSLTGLVRGLLYHVLCQVPSLTETLFPHIWDNASAVIGGRERTQLSPRQITQALSRLVEFSGLEGDQHSLQRFRICFFIDGLDEFDETVDETHGTLVRTLKAWVQNSRGNVKLCISSRIQEPFLRSFDKTQRITLSNLTRDDIALLVNNKLGCHERFKALQAQEPQECNELVRALTSRAEGVFLWVVLILGSITRGLDKGDPISLLVRRVSNTPQELNIFFASIMDQIEPVYREGSLLLLAVILRWDGITLQDSKSPPTVRNILLERNLALQNKVKFPGLTLVSCLLLLRTVDSRNPLVKYHLTDFNNHFRDFQGLSAEELKDAMTGVVVTRCYGLIEIAQGLFPGFIHRSIPEFLKIYIGNAGVRHGAPNNHRVTTAVAWCYLVGIQIFGKRALKTGLKFLEYEELGGIVWGDLAIHIQRLNTATDFTLDETIAVKDFHGRDRYISEERWRSQWNAENVKFITIIGLQSLEKHWDDVFSLLFDIEETLWQMRVDSRFALGHNNIYRRRPTLICDFVAEILPELPARMLQQTNIFDDERRLWQAVDVATDEHRPWPRELYEPILARLEVAVASGSLGSWPQEIWVDFLLRHFLILGDRVTSSIIESWLTYGVDPRVSFWIQVERSDAEKGGRTIDSFDKRIDLTVKVGSTQQRRFTNISCFSQWMQFLLSHGGGSLSLSLRQAIERADPKNKAQILHLIDSKLGKPSSNSSNVDSISVLEDKKPGLDEESDAAPSNSSQSPVAGRHTISWMISHWAWVMLEGQWYIAACVILGMGLVYNLY